MRLHPIKKFLILLSTVAAISAVGTPVLKAQGDNGAEMVILLKEISQNTAGMLQDMNNLPVYLSNIGQFILAWMSPDTSDTTAAMQGSFQNLANLLNTDMTTVASMQQQLNTDLLGQNATKTTLPYANDLVYSTLLGSPVFTPDPRNAAGKKATANPQYNYIKNAGAISINHLIPGSNWKGSQGAQMRYQNYYNVMMAAESFSGYVLSNQYVDGNQFNALQTTLITQASDPKNWFAQVASENIGFVLRQILLYESETFILLTQMLQVQKQMVTAQVMTNSLMVASNQMNENLLASYAQGVKPTM